MAESWTLRVGHQRTEKGHHRMKITVIGATGQIGRQVVAQLNDAGHQTVAASRRSGVDVLTGDGLAEALSGTDVLVDVINSPSFDDDPVMEFFSTATRNLVNAAKPKPNPSTVLSTSAVLRNSGSRTWRGWCWPATATLLPSLSTHQPPTSAHR